MTIRKKEFGDFQTPLGLSQRICAFLSTQDISPTSIIEPTCGRGSFVLSALEHFPEAKKIFGIDINAGYIESLNHELKGRNLADRVEIRQEDFFDLDWKSILGGFSEPLLIIGNPPWVTNSTLGVLNSKNSPKKTNFQHHSGLDAITGKSNFDISEWMLIHLIQGIRGRDGMLAMLCKTSAARKVLKYLWSNKTEIGQSRLYLLAGKQEFGISADICLLVYSTQGDGKPQTCKVYRGLSPDTYLTTYGFNDDQLVANIDNYERWKHLKSKGEKFYKWRSGVKHDAAKVMELTKDRIGYKNGLGETCTLEDEYVYPLLKSSDIAKSVVSKPGHWLLMPQTYIGEDTVYLKHKAPRIWDYLNNHQAFFDKRKSSIYKNRPNFSIFGVGDYSFAPWKVAISGLYKNLNFVVVGPYQGKPVMLDDTCYFIPCNGENEAQLLGYLLNSSTAKEFFGSFIFWDAKRPITADLLGTLDLFLLARELKVEEDINRCTQTGKVEQLLLWPT